VGVSKDSGNVHTWNSIGPEFAEATKDGRVEIVRVFDIGEIANQSTDPRLSPTKTKLQNLRGYREIPALATLASSELLLLELYIEQ
jgi:hypothetical protein